MSLSHDDLIQEVKVILAPLSITKEKCLQIKDLMISSMHKGLSASENSSSSIKMYPSYVVNIPDGKEKGTYLALDLGGTNYRILIVEMNGDKEDLSVDERIYSIPKEKMLGNADSLFSYIVETLEKFLCRYNLQNEKLQLGFTFSFPCNSKGLNEAYLVKWTKGFAASEVVGENVAKLLQDSIDKTNLKIKCKAIVNDTVGTLTACALEDPLCSIGLIIGTGTNAAYVEEVKNIELIRDLYNDHKYMIINTEWGAFGEKGELEEILTPWDRLLDKESLHPGEHIYEKLSSGMNLGEICRLILLDLIERKILFDGEVPEKLKKKNGFQTKFISETERDPPHLFYSTSYMLTEYLRVPAAQLIDSKIVRMVCEKVSTRAAYLIGAGIAALIHKVNRPRVIIGVDGSLYKFHPKFRERMMDIIHEMKPTHTEFHLRLSEDGSGKGAAAIVAAMKETSVK